MSVQLLRHCTPRRFLRLPCHRRSSTQVALASSSLSSHPESVQTSLGHSAQQQDTLASRNNLKFTKAESYLASIQAVGLEPTLVDAEKFRPARHSRPDTSKYAEEYHDLIDALCRAFSKDQLRRFTVLYKLDPKWSRAKRRKVEYAESIIEQQWGWPSLRDIEKKRIDKTEVVAKRFPVTPSELFLILGRDGADLLQLSIQYNVQISLTSDPLALQVEGLRGTLKQLAEYIDTLKKGVRHEMFELPTRRSIPPDLVQRISRLAGAYVENYGDEGKIRIYARNVSNMQHAKRLAIRASLEEGREDQTNIICYNLPHVKSRSPVSTGMPHEYYAYPFLVPSPFPWTMQAGGAFRIRRVADWLGLAHEDITKIGGLADSDPRFMYLTQKEEDLYQAILKMLDESGTSGHKFVTASLGHLLLSLGEKPHQPSLLSPLRGRMPLPQILKWLESVKTQMTFVPSFSTPTPFASRSELRTFHRLVYRTLRNSTKSCTSSSNAMPWRLVSFETELLPVPVANTGNGYTANVISAAAHLGLCNTLEAQCQIGEETILNLMVPDRPVDLQLSVLNCRQVPEAQLSQLSNYHKRLREFTTSGGGSVDQPYPPPAFDFEGHTYHLYDTWSVQQRTEHIILPTMVPDASSAPRRIPITYEKVLDLEGRQQLEQCKVNFDPSSDMRWKDFLVACDQLSVASMQSRSQEAKIAYSG